MLVDDLENTKEPTVHSSRSADPQIQSNPSVDPPLNSSRSVVSTGRTSSAAKKDVIDYLEKVDVDTRLEDIDQVLGSYSNMTSNTNALLMTLRDPKRSRS